MMPLVLAGLAAAFCALDFEALDVVSECERWLQSPPTEHSSLASSPVCDSVLIYASSLLPSVRLYNPGKFAEESSGPMVLAAFVMLLQMLWRSEHKALKASALFAAVHNWEVAPKCHRVVCSIVLNIGRAGA